MSTKLLTNNYIEMRAVLTFCGSGLLGGNVTQCSHKDKEGMPLKKHSHVHWILMMTTFPNQ